MSSVATANLVGITGIARRLVLDGALEEQAAREAMAAASAESARWRPIWSRSAWSPRRSWPRPTRSSSACRCSTSPRWTPARRAIKLVSEELVRKHHVLPLFKRGNRLFVGIADPTNTRALDEIKFQTNLAVEADPGRRGQDPPHASTSGWPPPTP